MYQSPLNIQQFIGRLTSPPELKETPNGKLLMTFSLAYSTRHSADKEGSFTSFINIEAWEKMADFYAPMLEKGMQVLVKGSLVQNRWVSKEGARRSTFKLVAHAISIVDLKRRPEIQTDTSVDQAA